MFYSHTFLARKGPLGTVWCAAHLQHRLKKSHYTSTDIPSTVERIMYPEVPIALRMSGHLLLGVVRIYSKKVDYLYQDYNFFLISIRKAFSSVEVNLPEDATHAPFHSVTLPDTFELDALTLDDDFYYNGTCPSLPVDPNAGFQDPSPSNEIGASVRLNGDSLPPNIPEIEVMRDAVHDFHVDNFPLWPDRGNDIIEPDRILEQQLINEKEILTPAVEGILVSGGQPLPSQQHGEPFNSAASDQALDVFDSHISFGHVSPELAIRSTPPVDKPKARPRKRKQLYDEYTVLRNRSISEGLDNCSDLRRTRKCCPSSALDVWKSQNKLRKENIFLEPLMTGLCADLCNIYKNEFISEKPHLVSVEEACPEPSVAHSPPCDPMGSRDMEIERLRNYDGPIGSNILPEIIGSPSRFMPSEIMGSPNMLLHRDDFTPAPASAGSLGSQSEPKLGTPVGTAVQPTPDLAESAGTLGSEMETPATFLGERLGLESTGLSDIPEVMNSAEADTVITLGIKSLNDVFLLLAELQGSEGVETLTGTTRKVAQYLKGKSSVTPISEDLSGDLILNKLLEGKTRKVCARMFFETLVLKSSGFVDAQQEEPYIDITLKLTSKLFKDQF
ncbi:Rad21/Rec8-like family protein [Actinidia rufa]|uniref:Rad21/Rec8-like family protein n=1 Tax=Actinidia rufa TaxID=165716 RepID=A0A7J0F0G2_9ERIC|nr:Rad21/Rec8-like family protein [Actinidia rufa]